MKAIFVLLYSIVAVCSVLAFLFYLVASAPGWYKLAWAGGIVLSWFVLFFCIKFSFVINEVIIPLWHLFIWPVFKTASWVVFFFVNIVLGWAFGDGFLAPMVISYWNITSEGFIVFWRIMCVLTSILYLELFWIGITGFISEIVDGDKTP